MIKPLPGYVLVEPLKEDRMSGGIYLPEDLNDKPSKGTVIALSDVMFFEGEILSIGGMTLAEGFGDIKIGSIVIFKKWVNQEVKFEGKEYLLVK